MLGTYQGTLHANQIEWSDGGPDLRPDEMARVQVTLLEKTRLACPASDSGRHMAAALERLAALDSRQGIPDAAAWEREMREDRVLPGRTG